MIPADFKEKICETVKYCTLPELEMLLIISEGLVKEYEKVKSSVRPKKFAKEHIRCNQKKYDNSSRFYRDYYGSDCGKLVRAIREYKRTRGSHRKDRLPRLESWHFRMGVSIHNTIETTFRSQNPDKLVV